GTEAVLHVAADYRLWVRDSAELFQANVEGTRIVMNAVLRHQVARVVYTSSVATLRPRLDGIAVDETQPLGIQEGLGDYKRRMVADIAALCGRRAPTVRLPRLPLFPLAVIAEAWGAMTGKEPFLTWDALRMARYKMFFSSAKAEAELGYRARPYGEALAEALA